MRSKITIKTMIMVPADKDKCVTIASWGDKISVPALVRPLSCSLGAKSTTGGGVGGGGGVADENNPPMMRENVQYRLDVER